jgi:anaphase-promoting complex subunit 3
VQVPSGATGHYLLGLIYRSVIHGRTESCLQHVLIRSSSPCRYTGRVAPAAEQFTQALTLDPLLWAAYEELCILGWCIRHPLLDF